MRKFWILGVLEKKDTRFCLIWSFEALQGPQGNTGKKSGAKSLKEKQPNFHLFCISFLLGLGKKKDFTTFQTFFFFFNHCFRMKLKGTVCKYLSNATEASRAHVPKAEPSEAEGNQCKNEGSQLQTTLPEKHWMGRTHPAPSPQSSPLQRPLHWKHLPHSGPGASLPPSPLIFWGRTSLFSEGSPLWMHNFIFGSVNPSLPCDQHSTPGNPALHAHLPGSGNGAKDRSASATDSSDYDQTRNFLFFWVFSLHQL